MRRATTLGLVVLGLSAASQTVAAAGTVATPIEVVPEWLIYAGLAAVCPEDINEAIMSRVGRNGGQG